MGKSIASKKSALNALDPNPHNQRSLEAESWLKDLCEIDTQTKNHLGILKAHTYVAEKLRNFGFQIEWKEPSEGVAPSLVHGWYQDVQSPSASPWTFVTHIDTVHSIRDAGSFSEIASTDSATGAGVIDNKGGVVVALQALKIFFHLHECAGTKPTVPIRFVSSPNEECGSTGFHQHFREWGKQSHLILGFEPALYDSSIIETRRGNRWYDIRVVGREAHAGRCAGEELNAAHDLAHKIVDLAKLSQSERGMNVNVAHFSGGRGPFNIVCGEGQLKLDVRFTTFEDRDWLHQKICQIVETPRVFSKQKGDSTVSSYTLADDCPPFSCSLESKSLLKDLCGKISRHEGREVESKPAGGAGDVNHFSHPAAVVVDGLGPVGGAMHTLQEHIHLPSLHSRSYALAEFLYELDRGPVKMRI